MSEDGCVFANKHSFRLFYILIHYENRNMSAKIFIESIIKVLYLFYV